MCKLKRIRVEASRVEKLLSSPSKLAVFSTGTRDTKQCRNTQEERQIQRYTTESQQFRGELAARNIPSSC